jgi:hypothetical protein
VPFYILEFHNDERCTAAFGEGPKTAMTQVPLWLDRKFGFSFSAELLTWDALTGKEQGYPAPISGWAREKAPQTPSENVVGSEAPSTLPVGAHSLCLGIALGPIGLLLAFTTGVKVGTRRITKPRCPAVLPSKFHAHGQIVTQQRNDSGRLNGQF